MPERTLPIPNEPGWPTTCLGDVCELIRRGTAPSYVDRSDVYAIGQRCVTASGFDPAFARPHDERRMGGTLEPRAGDVLLNSTGTGTIGRSCTFSSTGRFIVDGHVTVLRPKQSGVDGRWIEALVRSPWGQAYLESRCFSGSTNQVELSRTELASTGIPTPPIGEQQRISEVIATIDVAILSTERLIEKLKSVKRGLLDDLLTSGIDEDGKLRDPFSRPDDFVRTALGMVHSSWTIDVLGSLGRITSGTTPPRGQSRYWSGGSIPWVKTGEVQFNVIVTTEERVTQAAVNETSLRLLPVGTILIAMYGEGVTRGRCAFLGVPATTNQACAALEPDRARVSSRFLFHYLQSQYERVRDLGQGSHQTNLSGALLREMLVVVPTPAEQERIVDALEAVDLRMVKEDSTIRQLRAMKAGLLDDLLTGRVRVNTEGDNAT